MVVEIKDLLVRFNNFLLKSEGKNIFIQEAIREATGIIIENKDIQIKNNTIYLNIKSIYKNKIFINKEKIFLKLKELLGENHPNSFQ